MISLYRKVEISQCLIMVSDINYPAFLKEKKSKPWGFDVICTFSKCPNLVCWLVVMFFRFVTSGEIRKRAEFFEPFILGLTNATVEQVC